MPDPTRAMLRRAVPRFSRLAPAILLGIGSAASSVALLACSAWLIARAAEQPPVLYLSLGIVGVRAFALGRAAFRYLERLSGHDASFRQLATIRSGVFERMLPLAPDGLASSRRGDLLARFVGDVDELQNVPLRVVQPLVSAVVVLVLAVVGIGLLAPASAIGGPRLPRARHRRDPPRAAAGSGSGGAHAGAAPRRAAGGGRRARAGARRARGVRCGRRGSAADRRPRGAARPRHACARRGDGRGIRLDDRDRRLRRRREPRGRGAAARRGTDQRSHVRRALPRAARHRGGRRGDPAGDERTAPGAGERRAGRPCRARRRACGDPRASGRSGRRAAGRAGAGHPAARSPRAVASGR